MQTFTQTQPAITSPSTLCSVALAWQSSASSSPPQSILPTATAATAATAAGQEDRWEPRRANQGVGRPALPTALAEQIRQHPWARTAPSRVAEAGIAAAAANSPTALQAARQLTHAMWDRLQAVEPNVGMREIFGSYEGYNAAKGTARYWAGGDIHPDDVAEAFEHGNLRECMTMAFNASYRLERHMTAKGERGVFCAPPQSLAANASSMRTKRHSTKAGTSLRETAATLATPQSPPLSQREHRHLRDYLAHEHQGSTLGRLPTQLGKHCWQPRYEHPFMIEAVTHGLHVTAGVSGSTHRFMAAYRCLLGDAPLEAMRLACVGYFTPDHHSLHEVLTAAAWFGCAYDARQAPAAQLGIQL